MSNKEKVIDDIKKKVIEDIKKEVGKAIFNERKKRPIIKDVWIDREWKLHPDQLRRMEKGEGHYSFDVLLRYMECMGMSFDIKLTNEKELDVEKNNRPKWLDGESD